ncbi:MAG: hypothetical protein Q9182_005157 [Xanthomendoza sp. 2 TL-2023]
MPPSNLLSPSELSYLHTSLSLDPPIRPDARSPTTFRPLIAETDLLASTNGSARLCFADGTEAIVGVKAEVERTVGTSNISSGMNQSRSAGGDEDMRMHSADVEMDEERKRHARDTTFDCAEQLSSTATQIDEDPLFNDDWDAAQPLYASSGTGASWRPPFTLLVISVGDNIFFDSSREELAVADAVCAVSVGSTQAPISSNASQELEPKLRLLSLRTIDPPSRLAAAASTSEAEDDQGAWRAARGGMKRTIVGKMVKMILESGGVGEEVMRGLEGFSGG